MSPASSGLPRHFRQLFFQYFNLGFDGSNIAITKLVDV